MTIATLLVLIGTGILAGFMGSWWGRGWIWTSLALLIAISVAMSFMGRLYFYRVRRALGAATAEDQKKKSEPAAVPPDQLAAVLNAGQPRLLAGVGVGGLAAITGLMIFKSF
jgi:hypothetical protein